MKPPNFLWRDVKNCIGCFAVFPNRVQRVQQSPGGRQTEAVTDSCSNDFRTVLLSLQSYVPGMLKTCSVGYGNVLRRLHQLVLNPLAFTQILGMGKKRRLYWRILSMKQRKLSRSFMPGSISNCESRLTPANRGCASALTCSASSGPTAPPSKKGVSP